MRLGQKMQAPSSPALEKRNDLTARRCQVWHVGLMVPKGFEHARTAALCATGVGRGKFRLGAVVMRDTHVISAGFNSYKTHTKLARVTEYPCLHAETHAMFRAGLDNIEGLTMYVIRLGKDGSTRLAKPCMVCQHYIHLSALGNVYYTIDQKEYGTL